ncbi:MAG: UMP kinase [Patescibacteria group bacterium]|jgi:uridylate kinase
MNKKTVVISLGGSVVAPEEGIIDYLFLKKFKAIIIRQVKKGTRFIIVVGGGKTARIYQGAAKKVGQLVPEDIDWIGIYATRLNGHLLRTIFRQYAQPKINTKPFKVERFNRPILIGAGWRPGFSTDFDAVKLAIGHGASVVINLSNIDFVYSADPRKDKNAKKLEKISWLDFLKLVGKKWTPGANLPFDPIASRLAAKKHLPVLIMAGRDLKNFEGYLNSGKFKGTVIG